MARTPKHPRAPRKPVSMRIDPLVWRAALVAADGAGVTLTSVVERQLIEFVRVAQTPRSTARYLASLPGLGEGIV